MDPNACYAEMMQLLNADRTLGDDECMELGELAFTLHEWLARRGFVPEMAMVHGLTRNGLSRLTTALVEVYGEQIS